MAQRRFGPGTRWSPYHYKNMVELPVAPLLRTLAPELWANVIELLQQPRLAQLVLNISADHPCRVLRPQCQRLRLLRLRPRAVFPRIHLFGDDVGLFAHAARKKAGVLKNRRADLPEVVARKDAPRRLFDKIPEFSFRRQKVPRAANGF